MPYSGGFSEEKMYALDPSITPEQFVGRPIASVSSSAESVSEITENHTMHIAIGGLEADGKQPIGIGLWGHCSFYRETDKSSINGTEARRFLTTLVGETITGAQITEDRYQLFFNFGNGYRLHFENEGGYECYCISILGESFYV